ncbi:MAG: serine phosphatase RsbU (regulator of sigma subunit) [Flavobacteriales bacterium]|jgi:serine phosphatase RsbU (regulator of sigma subunit)
MLRFFKYGSVKIFCVVFFGIVVLVGTLIVHSFQLRIESVRKSHVAKLETIGRTVVNEIKAQKLFLTAGDHAFSDRKESPEKSRLNALLLHVAELHLLKEPIRLVLRNQEGDLAIISTASFDDIHSIDCANKSELEDSHLAILANTSMYDESKRLSSFTDILDENGKHVAAVQLSLPFQPVLDLERSRLYDQIGISAATLLLIGALMCKSIMATMRKEWVRESKLKLKNAIIERKNQDITASIKYAKRLQSAFKPKQSVLEKSFSKFFAINMPKDIIGGDFFWFHDQPSMDLKVVVQADCTGHGVPGAMMSVLGNTLLAEIVVDYDVFDPAMILELMNQKLMTLLNQENAESLSDGMDISVCALNTKTNELTYAAANLSVILIRDNELIQLRGDRNPIGGFHFELDRKFSNKTVSLKKNDQIYMYTDGYQDQFGGEFGKRLKRRGFHNLLLATSANSFSQQHDILLDKFTDWKGAREQVDDVSLLGFEIS